MLKCTLITNRFILSADGSNETCYASHHYLDKIIGVIRLLGISYLELFSFFHLYGNNFWSNHFLQDTSSKDIYITVILKRINYRLGLICFLECTHDSHCTNCAVGQTGKCHRHHDTERKFCQCEGRCMVLLSESWHRHWRQTLVIA